MTSVSLKIAVTGAAGKVGVAVVSKCLEQGHTVLALDHADGSRLDPQDKLEYRQVDATDFAALKDALAGCNALIHLAVYNDTTSAESDGFRQSVGQGAAWAWLTPGSAQCKHRHVVQCALRLRRARHQPCSPGVKRECDWSK
jgi:uncharacterized protein YbjT (DUF2867 family)